MSIINVFRNYGADYQDVKDSAELDARINLSIVKGKRYPYAITIEPVKSKITKKNSFRADIVIFDNELERDLFKLRINKNFKPLNDN